MGRDQDKTRLTLGGDLSGSLPAYTACTVAVAHQTLAWPDLAVEMPQMHVWPLVELARGEEEEMDTGDGDGHASSAWAWAWACAWAAGIASGGSSAGVDLLLTLLPAPCCVRFNFHPSMVITGFFLDPSC